jgi:mono/diheme cytochrome c family protein
MSSTLSHRKVAPRVGPALIAVVLGVWEPATAGDQASGAAAPASGPSARTSATAPARAARTPVPPHPATRFPAAVIQVYRASCLQCHDVDGRGEVVRDTLPRIPDFTEAKWHSTRTDAELSRSILEGKGKSMPRMKGKLGSVDVQQMVAFVRGFRGGDQVVDDEPAEPSAPQQPTTGTSPTVSVPRPDEPRPPTPKELSIRAGSQSFQRFCARCHGPDGRGSGIRDSMPAIPDFTARAWHERRRDPQLVVSILDGKGAEMPAFQGKVAREQARDLVAFIRAFAPGSSPPSGAASDDFEARFRQLMQEFETLRRQSQADFPPSSDPSPKPPRSHVPPAPPRQGTVADGPQSIGRGRSEGGG